MKLSSYQNKENRAIKSNLPEYEGGDLEEYMYSNRLRREILYTHQKQCEKSGKYVEADLAKRSDVQKLVKIIGGFDVIIANAGVGGEAGGADLGLGQQRRLGQQRVIRMTHWKAGH